MYRIIVILLFLIVGVGCNSNFTTSEITNFTDIKLAKDEVILVGKINILPGIKKEEINMKFGSCDNCHKTIVLGYSYQLPSKYKNILKLDAYGTYDEKTFIAPLEKLFYLKRQKKDLYIIGGLMYFSVTYGGVGKMEFPARYKVNVKPTDQVVYIGTLQFHRDDFNTITKKVVLDEFKKAKKDFKSKFKSKLSFRKSLLHEKF